MMKLEQVRAEMIERFERLDRRLAQQEQRFERLNQRVIDVAERIDDLRAAISAGLPAGSMSAPR